MKPIISSAGEGERLAFPDGNTMTFRAVTEDTDGNYSLCDYVALPHWPGPPEHSHEFDEAFYVIEGTFQFRVGEDVVEATSGAFVFVPRGTSHTFSNPTAETSRLIGIFSPSGAEKAFRARSMAIDARD